MIDLTFKAADDSTILESHSEYILLTPISISTGDNTNLLGRYSSFDVKTVLNVKFTLPAALIGYSATTTNPQGFVLFTVTTGSFDTDFGITSATDFMQIPCALATESTVLAVTGQFACRIRTNDLQPKIFISGF